ncbi:MAG: ABC transporter ATP-binding protein [Nanoarchaeota archaeon]|nr:ABC transporter ATP-binding protein [Nanoarchaeota archaeon]
MAKIEQKNSREKIDFKYNMKVYWSFIRKYKKLLLIIIALALLIEASYIADKFLFKIIIDRGTEYANDTLPLDKYVQILFAVAIAFLSYGCFRVVFKWIYIHYLNRLNAHLIIDLKQRFFNHILGLSYSFHTTHKTGSLISRLMRGAGGIERMTDFIIFNTLPLAFQFVIVGASLLYFEVSTAFVVLLTAVVFIGYSLVILRFQKASNIYKNKCDDIEKANVADIFTNIDSIKYFGKEANIRGRFAKLSTTTKKAAVKHWDYFRWFDAGHSLILIIGTFFLIYFPLKSFLAGEITLGTVVFIYTVYGNIVGPLFGFVYGVRGYYHSMADFQDLFQYGRIDQEVKDLLHSKEMKVQHGGIEFKDVAFRYPSRPVFRNFNLKIKPGEKVALVGHSGSGKTTLIKLLYRLYDVEKGQILLDGKDIREFKQENLRSELSIVPQECILFDDTIYNNILFSRPGATRKNVMQAMKFAQLDRIVKVFPNKEQTVVGERGVKLSGGEKQRVSIARAILANKKIIVLDEATSSLDSHTENEIQKDLHELLRGRTAIIIAHRLSTIMHADKIIVLDRGEIVQVGKHNDLIGKDGLYKKLWDLQKGGYLQEE